MSKRLVIVQDEMGCLPRYVSTTTYEPRPIRYEVITKQLLNPREHRGNYPDFLKTQLTPTTYYYDRTSLYPEPIREPYVIGIQKHC